MAAEHKKQPDENMKHAKNVGNRLKTIRNRLKNTENRLKNI